MRVFVTGATGFIGSNIVHELVAAGHEVIGLARSPAGAAALRASGARPHSGTLEDLNSLRGGAAQADGVIHCAFDHDFTKFAENCDKDGHAIKALGAELAGSDRPIIITSSTGMGDPGDGGLAREDVFDPRHPNPRTASEIAGAALLEAGINLSVVRLPQVHDTRKQGLVSFLVGLARVKGVSAHVGSGLNRWPAAHVSDVARLYRLALERRRPGARYHAVDEEGVATRDIATAIGRGLDLPVVPVPAEAAAAHFGWLATFAGLDMAASSARTRACLDWRPSGARLLTDLEQLRSLDA